RAADPLGELLAGRSHELQLAAAARSRAGSGLRHLARGLPSRGDGPLAALLGVAGLALPRLPGLQVLAAAPRGAARARLSSAPRAPSVTDDVFAFEAWGQWACLARQIRRAQLDLERNASISARFATNPIKRGEFVIFYMLRPAGAAPPSWQS